MCGASLLIVPAELSCWALQLLANSIPTGLSQLSEDKNLKFLKKLFAMFCWIFFVCMHYVCHFLVVTVLCNSVGLHHQSGYCKTFRKVWQSFQLKVRGASQGRIWQIFYVKKPWGWVIKQNLVQTSWFIKKIIFRFEDRPVVNKNFLIRRLAGSDGSLNWPPPSWF